MGRRRKQKKGHVISIRISDDELEGMNWSMKRLRISTVSDLMRRAMEVAMEKPLFGESAGTRSEAGAASVTNSR